MYIGWYEQNQGHQYHWISIVENEAPAHVQNITGSFVKLITQ